MLKKNYLFVLFTFHFLFLIIQTQEISKINCKKFINLNSKVWRCSNLNYCSNCLIENIYLYNSNWYLIDSKEKLANEITFATKENNCLNYLSQQSLLNSTSKFNPIKKFHYLTKFEFEQINNDFSIYSSNNIGILFSRCHWNHPTHTLQDSLYATHTLMHLFDSFVPNAHLIVNDELGTNSFDNWIKYGTIASPGYFTDFKKVCPKDKWCFYKKLLVGLGGLGFGLSDSLEIELARRKALASVFSTSSLHNAIEQAIIKPLDSLESNQQSKPNLIIVQSLSTRSSVDIRHIENLDEILNSLKLTFPNYNIIVEQAKPQLTWKISLMQNATILIAPDGSLFDAIAWANPNIKFIVLSTGSNGWIHGELIDSDGIEPFRQPHLKFWSKWIQIQKIKTIENKLGIWVNPNQIIQAIENFNK
eukprot:TRINITY_DN2191_c0_g2_i1.p1 TRINITY_DN2191_c0_g2~~TRINITY_DN2191_c0_g2_i1.p1  ORF type:complete len:425 (-),score=192.43 TRINITY_DN2191_c0_g2_i1:95-1348(-)